MYGWAFFSKVHKHSKFCGLQLIATFLWEQIVIGIKWSNNLHFNCFHINTFRTNKKSLLKDDVKWKDLGHRADPRYLKITKQECPKNNYFLYISTIIWVLSTPNANWNMLFSFCRHEKGNRNKKKEHWGQLRGKTLLAMINMYYSNHKRRMHDIRNLAIDFLKFIK